jgi:excisionase family DNA binding protein
MTDLATGDCSSRKAAAKFFTVGEIAEQLYVSTRTVHRWIAKDELVVHRFERAVRVSEADLKAFLALHRDAK